jgi:hypothetical protein
LPRRPFLGVPDIGDFSRGAEKSPSFPRLGAGAPRSAAAKRGASHGHVWHTSCSLSAKKLPQSVNDTMRHSVLLLPAGRRRAMLRHLTSLTAGGCVLVALSQGPFVDAAADMRLVGSVASQHEHASTPPAPVQSSPAESTSTMRGHDQMMAEMKAADAKLEDLVKGMNAATGDARISAIAQVVNELVRQQKAMHEHMATMDHQMMMGGKAMMQKGGSEAGKK